MESKKTITINEVFNKTDFPNNFKLYLTKDTSMYDITKVIKHFKDLGLYTEMVYDTNRFMFRVVKSTVKFNNITKIDKSFEEKIDDSLTWMNLIKDNTSFLILLTSYNSNEYKRTIDDTILIERGSILYDRLLNCLNKYKNDITMLKGGNDE